jgi:SAM-dependent methyltransferase
VPTDVHSTRSDPSVADYFDLLYGSEERYWWRVGDPYSLDPKDYPTALLTQVTLRLLRDSGRTGIDGHGVRRALDLGAGEGADSIRLARLGYEVTAVDISPTAVKKISAFATDAGADLTAEIADIGEYLPDGLFDVIILNGVLHYIRDKATVIERMQAATRPGGLHVVSAWSSFTAVPACHNSIPVYCDDEDGVLVATYRNWDLKLIYFERDKAERSHGGMPRHSHSHIKIIAEKPGP